MSKRKTVAPPDPAPIMLETIQEIPATLAGKQVADSLERGLLADFARGYDSPFGFSCFYEVVTGDKLPAHAAKWIAELYAVKNAGEKKGIVIEAFRGSTKTTTLTILFTAYRIGKEPHLDNLLIQVGDDIARDNTAQIADLIANNLGWKLVFPNVEPDRERGWGDKGYEVKRVDIPYSEWRQLNSQRKDPTFVGLSYKSSAIIGKHPK